MAKLASHFYYFGGAKESTLRLSQLNKVERKAAFRYYDEMFIVHTLGGRQTSSKGHRRQEYCEVAIQRFMTREGLVAFLKELNLLPEDYNN